MKTLIIILILIVIILAAIFLPVYNGRVGNCGVVAGGGCWNYKLNLIEYIKYKNHPESELLKECPDEMILNKMPRVEGASRPKLPPSYYIKDGVRREIQEYDHEWLRNNCTIPVQEVY